MRLKPIVCFVPERSAIDNVLPCKSRVCAPDLAPTVKVFNGIIFVVARTTQKKLAPDCGADAKVIWSSLIVNDVSGSWMTPPNDTSKVYGLPGKNASLPIVKLKTVLLLLNCELTSSRFAKAHDYCWRQIYAI